VAITLINEDDMIRFQRIEKLIESKIIKLPVPPEIGQSPEWKTKPRRKPQKKGYKKRRK
jgi:hypothetical protein